MSGEPYSRLVRRYFENPVHAGDLPTGYARVRAAVAAGGPAGFRIELAAGLAAGRLARLRFRAYGCPHLIAAAEATCAAFEGREWQSLAEFDVAALRAALEVPVEKTGRLLLLEDAVRALAAAIAREQTGEEIDRND